jgi:hypothetical protein
MIQPATATIGASNHRHHHHPTQAAGSGQGSIERSNNSSMPRQNLADLEGPSLSNKNDIANTKPQRVQRSADRKQRKQALGKGRLLQRNLESGNDNDNNNYYENDDIDFDIKPGAVSVPAPVAETVPVQTTRTTTRYSASSSTEFVDSSRASIQSAYGQNTATTNNNLQSTSMEEDSSSSEDNQYEDDDDEYEGEDAGELVIAAELSQDLEREIEERIRRQIMEEAAHASVVVGHVVVGQVVEEKATTTTPIKVPKIYPRTSLPWRVEQETATHKWVSTVQTNHKAKTLPLLQQQRGERSFLAATKKEAVEIAMAMATPGPRTIGDSTKACGLCQRSFTFLNKHRKKWHCRNCGIGLLCAGCTTTWHKTMVPETYYSSLDTTNASSATTATVNVCTACDWSARQFQRALLRGDMAEARYLYKHHNINLRTPYNFLNKKKKEVL